MITAEIHSVTLSISPPAVVLVSECSWLLVYLAYIIRFYDRLGVSSELTLF